MIISHFQALVLFSFFVSIVFSVIGKQTLREQFVYGVKVFIAFVGIAIVLGWIMYPFA